MGSQLGKRGPGSLGRGWGPICHWAESGYKAWSPFSGEGGEERGSASAAAVLTWWTGPWDPWRGMDPWGCLAELRLGLLATPGKEHSSGGHRHKSFGGSWVPLEEGGAQVPSGLRWAIGPQAPREQGPRGSQLSWLLLFGPPGRRWDPAFPWQSQGWGPNAPSERQGPSNCQTEPAVEALGFIGGRQVPNFYGIKLGG